MKIKREKEFVSVFDEATGRYFRTGILENGKDTGKDPFMSSFPELLDIGIMGHCIHGRQGLCMQAGVECYQDGLHAQNPNMSLADFERIAKECRGKTYQFALGGCGDPEQHEHFEDILKICHDNHIVPNFTTSGLGMTEEIARLCKKYCGAVAVSWYRSEYTNHAIKLLTDSGVKTNIHYVLSKNTIGEAITNLKKHKFPPEVNAIVFLLHKPIGLGSRDNLITSESKEFRDFLWFIDAGEHLPYKLGFDSCTVPALITNSGTISPDSLDTCEGARWSAYITADMKMLPCSFDNQEQRWAVDLRENTIKEVWDSEVFEDFRNHFRKSCPHCEKKEICMGGCPICPEIVLCKDR